MKKTDDAGAKQAMLDALAAYTGPITREAKASELRTCQLSEFGECKNVFTVSPVDMKKWTKFCCTEHRKRWHYLNRNGTAKRRDAVEDAGVNGHAPAKKLTLADLGFAAPTTQPLKRRKLNGTQDASGGDAR